ncbi:unnamed protein product [Ceratitis capitata]|uniref:(Mediterranean fruit fly) hypothetical protein n=1 Tax=Ceratitis capitata TaxID=7213 RepID=A0A811ULC2_CERCA|nr:unnamed protein product [Ceratitis capitata]
MERLPDGPVEICIQLRVRFALDSLERVLFGLKRFIHDRPVDNSDLLLLLMHLCIFELYKYIIFLTYSLITTSEIVRAEHSKHSTEDVISTRRYVFMDYEIPVWMVESYKSIGAFGFGAAVCQLITDIAKYSIGRLRPHFFAVSYTTTKYLFARAISNDSAENKNV